MNRMYQVTMYQVSLHGTIPGRKVIVTLSPR